MKPPNVSIDVSEFWKDPYPALAHMRAKAPICYVPELDAVLVTKRDDIFRFEKNISVFSSKQPGGLMTVLMGENMMRKSGDPHKLERTQMQPSVSPSATAKVWKNLFESDTHKLLDSLSATTSCDLVKDYAMPVSANALRRVTGLVNMTPGELDASSQGMIDGIANYAGDTRVEARCHEMTALIDASIDEMLPQLTNHPDHSLLSTLSRSGQAMDSVRANIKLAISGGQNEPRTAIAGTAWALLNHPDQLASIRDGRNTWQQAFEEYARWISPIGMSPRRIACRYQYGGIDFEEGDRAFLMFGSGNRDESIFDHPELFNVERNTSKAISFGAGPHFCAGAWVSRCLIGEVALPMLFNRYPNLRLNGEAEIGGWAFRDLLSLPVMLQ